MKNRFSPVLLALFFLGLGLLWWLNWARVPTGEERRLRTNMVLPQLTRLSVDQVEAIEIRGPGATRIVLERVGPQRWYLREPFQTRADRREAEHLVQGLRNLSRYGDSGEIQLGFNPDRYGFGKESWSVRLYGKNRENVVASLELGQAIEDRLYVREPGSTIGSVVEAARLQPLRKSAEAWRERSVFDVYAYDIGSIQVEGDGRLLSLELQDGRWRIRQPIRAAADPEKTNQLLSDLATLEAVEGKTGFPEIEPENLKTIGLDPPRFTVQLVPLGAIDPDDRQPRRVEFGDSPPAREDLIYARRSGEQDVLAVPRRTLEGLGIETNRLRSRKVLDVEPNSVEAIEISRAGEVTRLARSERAWRVLSPKEGPADEPTVGQLLSVLASLETAEFRRASDEKLSGLSEPTAVIKVWESEAGGPHAATGPTPFPSREADYSLMLGRYAAEIRGWLGQLGGDEGTILLLPATIGEVLPSGPLTMLDRTLGTIDPAQIVRIQIERGEELIELRREEIDGNWSMISPVRAPTDPAVIRLMTVALGRLRADALESFDLSNVDLNRYGLATPILRIRWSSSPTGPGQGLLIGEAVNSGSRGRYALLEGEGPLCTLSPSTLSVLMAEPRLRRLLTLRADQIQQIEMRDKQGNRLVATHRLNPTKPPLRESPGQWSLQCVGMNSGTTEQWDSLLESLANLTAVTFVQHSGPFPPPTALESPRLIIRLTSSNADPPFTLRLGAQAPEGLVYATLGEPEEGMVFTIPEAPYLPWLLPADRELPDALFEQQPNPPPGSSP